MYKISDKIKNNKFAVILLRAVFSYCAAAGVAYYYFYGKNLVLQSAFNFSFFILIYILLQKASSFKKRTKRIAFSAGAVYSVVICVGKALYDTNGFITLYGSYKRVLITLVMLFGIFIITGLTLSLILNFLETHDITDNKNSNNLKGTSKLNLKTPVKFLILWGVNFIAYIPCLLAYWPGIYAYDMKMQSAQAIGAAPFDKFHPPLHTFLWKVCIKIGSIIPLQAITVYALLQMALLSCFFASVLIYLRNKNKKLFVIGFIWFALNPIFALFSINPTKDVCFSVFFGWTILLIYDALKNTKAFFKKPIKISALLICILLSCLFRNNAVYVFIVCVPLFAVFFKGVRIKAAAVLVCALALFMVINGPLLQALGVKKGNNREKLSVPMQQIALTVVRNESKLTQEEKSTINKFLDYKIIKQKFNYRFADPIKSSFKTDYYDCNKKEFLKLWTGLGLKYPKEYIIAFMDLNLPYWFIDADSVDTYSQRRYIETSAVSNNYYTINRNSKLPWLYNCYEKAADYSIFRKILIVSNIFSIATPIWAILFTGLCLIFKRKYKQLLVLLPPALLWATYLLGPVSNFRYVLPFTMLYPLFLLLIFNKENT